MVSDLASVTHGYPNQIDIIFQTTVRLNKKKTSVKGHSQSSLNVRKEWRCCNKEFVRKSKKLQKKILEYNEVFFYDPNEGAVLLLRL